jgi:hypothetical protein
MGSHGKFYQLYRRLLCLLGIHEWIPVKYRKKDRMLIFWEECSTCQKVKEA